MLRKLQLIIIAFALWPLAAAAEKFQEGVQYYALPDDMYNRSLMSTNENQVEVVEFFSYGCPYCGDLEPVMHAWVENEAPEGMVVRRVPVTFFPAWTEYARAYYVTEVLGNTDEMHPKLFEAVLEERRPLNNKEELEAFFVDQDVDATAFERAYTGVTLGPKVQQGERLFAHYKLTSTPAIVVNGKYRTDVVSAGGEKELTEVVNFLVEQELDVIKCPEGDDGNND